jgi:outer membrane protein, heavy metal efflux system
VERRHKRDLRSAFVQMLQQKALLAVTRASLAYYDRVLDVSCDRLNVGDIAQVDLRTAKIQFRALLNDSTPIDNLDVTGPFDFQELPMTPEQFRRQALDNRPDLRCAVQAVAKARTDYLLAIASGSIDPTIGWDLGREAPDIPLRPYKARYLKQAAGVRDTISYSYQHGGASLLAFLQAQQDYRSIQLSYVNLIGAFLTAEAQMNLAVGDEVIQ